MLPSPTGFVGCGNMGGAIVDGWRVAGIDLSPITVIRPSGKAIEGARTVTKFADAGPPPKPVVLAFKPQKPDKTAPHLRTWLTPKTAVISFLPAVGAACRGNRF